MLSSEQRPETEQQSIMNILKEVQTRELGRTEQDERQLESRGAETRKPAVLGSIGSSEMVKVPAASSSEFRPSLMSTTKRLMSQQMSRKRHTGKALGEQFVPKRLQELERKIKSPDALPGSLIGPPEQMMRSREDGARRESREFNIKDARQQPTSSLAKATAADSGPKVPGQEKEGLAGLPADLHDLASASLSNQVQIIDGEAAAVRSVNPLSELQADEEFVIKNYRLIKKKKGGLGPIHDRRMAHVKEPVFA